MSLFINKFFGLVRGFFKGKGTRKEGKESVPEPLPEILHEPEPQIEPEPAHEPAQEPQVEPEPVYEPVPEPQIEPEPVYEPAQEPQVEPEPVYEPVQEPQIEPEPVREPMQEPQVEPEPVYEPVQEPQIEPEPVHEPVLELQAEAESKTEPEAESESAETETEESYEYKHDDEYVPEVIPVQQEQKQQEQKNEHEQEQELTPEPELQPRVQELITETESPKPEQSVISEDDSYAQKIRNIITEHYSYYGFPVSDTQGYSRFRTYAKSYGIELPCSNNELRRLIISSGTFINGTVYVFADEDIKNILCEADRLINSSGIIYFSELGNLIEDSNLYYNLDNTSAVREILKDHYSDKGYIFSELLMESESKRRFASYFESLKFIITKYFPDGFNEDYATLRHHAERENILLSGNDKALKRETEALKRLHT